ncbi:MAG TPA: hypothetical protein VIS48_08780 [Candidatus Kryptonia bacterium]
MKQTSAISDKLRLHFESALKKRISRVLELMYANPSELVDLESGEKYICSVCDMENKRCEREPDYRCEIARKCETEFKELELAVDRLHSGSFGFCMRCSAFIGIEELEKEPTRVFCESCASD